MHSGQDYTHDTNHIIDSTHIDRSRSPTRTRRHMYHRKVRLSQLALQFGMDGGELLRRQRLLRPFDDESLRF